MTRIPLNKSDELARQMKRNLALSTAQLGLDVRTANALEQQGVFTVEDLLAWTPERLLEIPNFGEKTLKQIFNRLAAIGFSRRSREGLSDSPVDQ
jgi:DNA-directed RNA polymerase subunit alpha